MFFRSFKKVPTQPAHALSQVQLRDVGNQGDVHVHQVFFKNNSAVPGKIAKKVLILNLNFFTSRSHKFGRQRIGGEDDDDEYGGGFGYYGGG